MTTPHTPGPWFFHDGSIYANKPPLLPNLANRSVKIVGYDPKTVFTDKDLSVDEMHANARLIAEAGTVAHETGLTPRQLADQRAELLAALRRIITTQGQELNSGALDQAQAAIANAERAARAEKGSRIKTITKAGYGHHLRHL